MKKVISAIFIVLIVLVAVASTTVLIYNRDNIKLPELPKVEQPGDPEPDTEKPETDTPSDNTDDTKE